MLCIVIYHVYSALLCCVPLFLLSTQWHRNHGGAGGWRHLKISAGTWACSHTHARTRLHHVWTEQTVLCCAPVNFSARIDGAEIDRLILWPTIFSVRGRCFSCFAVCLSWMPRPLRVTVCMMLVHSLQYR